MFNLRGPSPEFLPVVTAQKEPTLSQPELLGVTVLLNEGLVTGWEFERALCTKMNRQSMATKDRDDILAALIKAGLACKVEITHATSYGYSAPTDKFCASAAAKQLVSPVCPKQRKHGIASSV